MGVLDVQDGCTCGTGCVYLRYRMGVLVVQDGCS